jgi:hypothetical protein
VVQRRCDLFDDAVGSFGSKSSLAEMPFAASDFTCLRTMTMSPGANEWVCLLTLRISMCRKRRSEFRMLRMERWRYKRGVEAS